MIKSPVWIAATALFAVVVGTVAVLGLTKRGESPRVVSSGAVSIGGPFTLTDHNGQTFTDADFAGKLTLVYFGYTLCPDVCPTTLQTVAQALDLLGEDANGVQGLFISVDPERDTPEVLADYVPHFHEQITGLTGTAEQIAEVAKMYRVYFAKSETDDTSEYLMDHSSILYLMGPDGGYLTHIAHGATPEAIAETVRGQL